ncbi:MAG: hypothetical protein ACNA8K_06040, partial [Cyclonatronaceae bacterium]
MKSSDLDEMISVLLNDPSHLKKFSRSRLELVLPELAEVINRPMPEPENLKVWRNTAFWRYMLLGLYFDIVAQLEENPP